MPYSYELRLEQGLGWEGGQAPGAAPVLVVQGWVAESAGVAQRILNSSVVSPDLRCAGLICVSVFLTLSLSLCCSVGQFCIKEKVRNTR